MCSDSSGIALGKTQPFHSLEVAATAVLDTAALARAMLRATVTDSKAGPDSVLLIEGDSAGGDGWWNFKWQVWWVLPGLWRDDLRFENGEVIINIVRPDAALTYVSMAPIVITSEAIDVSKKRRLVSAEGMQLPVLEDRLIEFPLIRPRLPDSDWELELLQPEVYMGRPARRVHAARRAVSIRTVDPRLSGFWEGVDEYECVIDDELRIVLSVTGLVDKKVAATISVDRMRVDAPIAVDTFDFSPPPDTPFVHLTKQKTL